MMPTRRQMTQRLSTSMPWLDKTAATLKTALDPLFGENGPKGVKDALYGTWLGHPLHPMVTDLPIGFWTSSFLLDLFGMEKGSDITLKAGTVSALGAAVTGWAQWYDVQEMEEPRRLGALHASLNGIATGFYGLSWYFRAHDRRTAGIAASTVGMTLASTGAWLGGDLSYRLGIGVSRLAFEEPETEWTDAAAEAELEDGKPLRAEVGGVPVLLYRQGDQVLAVSATCTHVGGPLDEGEVTNGCVTCPWHGSEFDLASGRVLHGPATDDLRTYETRIHNGQVQVRPAA